MGKAVCPEKIPGGPGGIRPFFRETGKFPPGVFHKVQNSGTENPPIVQEIHRKTAEKPEKSPKNGKKCTKKFSLAFRLDKITEKLQKNIKKGLTRCRGGV